MARLVFTRRKKILLAFAAVLLFLLLVAIPAYIAYASVHPPRCNSSLTPSDYGLDYENFTVNTSDGVELRGWVVKPQNHEREPIVIVLHGYTSCKAADYVLEVSAGLARDGYRVVLFDFRAHGESGGDKTTIGPLEARFDAPAVINYTANHYPGRPLVLLGYSMGAVVAIVSGNSNPHVTAIIADSPYPVLDRVIPRWLKAKMGIPSAYSKIIGYWGRLMTGETLDFGPMKMETISKPLLVIAGTKDPLIKPDEAEQIASLSPEGQAEIVQGAGHVEAYKTLGINHYLTLLEDFIDTSTNGQH